MAPQDREGTEDSSPGSRSEVHELKNRLAAVSAYVQLARRLLAAGESERADELLARAELRGRGPDSGVRRVG